MPLSTRGSACNALIAERGKIGFSTSPSEKTVLPAASTIEMAPLWRDSTASPRKTSTVTGFVTFGLVQYRLMSPMPELAGDRQRDFSPDYVTFRLTSSLS